MNYLEKYQEARNAGYTDQQILQHLSTKDPSLKEKMAEAQKYGYTPEQVLEYFNTGKEKRRKEIESLKNNDMMTPDYYTKDFTNQAVQGLGIGVLGTIGDVLDLLHLQPKEGAFHQRFPSTEDIEKQGKERDLVSEPKSVPGRYGRRIGRIGGGNLAFGGTNIAAPITAGIAGQTAEEAGLPSWAQALVEFVSSLKSNPKIKTPVTSQSKAVQGIVEDLRATGYSEQDITLAKNALEDRNILKKYARLTPQTENVIQQGIKNSENLFKEEIKKGLPGYAKGGLPYLEKQASHVYQAMEELAASVPIKNKSAVKKSLNDAIAYLEKYPLLDEQKKFIEFMKDGLAKIDKAETAEFFTGFYRNLGKAGNWGDPKQKEHLLGLVKEGIKKTFAESGPDGAKFGKYFEKTNEAWKHWLKTRDLMETIEKAATVEGMNFKKLAGIFNDPENYELAKKVFPKQLENMKIIIKGADAIESLLKQIPKADKASNTIKMLEGIKSLVSGDFKTLGTLIGMEAAKRLATQLLIDPDKQDLMKKLIIAAKNNSRTQVVSLAQELVKEDNSPAKEEEEQAQQSVK